MFKFNYCITYHLNKINDKSDILTHHSEDLFKKRNTFDSWHQYQHQTILKIHVLNLKIVENLIFNVKVRNLQLYIIILDSVQLHLFLIFLTLLHILVLMNLKIKESDVENIDSQLNQDILSLDEDFADTFTQTLWKQVEINDKFASQIIKVLCNEMYHYNKISLVKCKKLENHLYFQERKYVFNSDKLRLCINKFLSAN